jgi:serine/threonine protein kinase
VRSDLSPGAVITLEALQGERVVVETVRAGGMGIVAKLVALRPATRPWAFKTYQQLSDAERFEKEASAWSSLSGHRNIARLDWFGRWQGASATLGAWYPRSLAEASFVADPEKGLELIVGIVKALVHAVDERGILHRDVKPANVLIDDGGEARLGDFGLAAAMAPRGYSMRSIATVGDVAGTPLYMAPELFAGQQPSVTSELYALGVTIYEFVTGGEHPYLGADTSLQFRPHLREEPLVRLSRSVGPLVDVLPALLALDPRHRPRSVTDVLHALGEGRNRAHLRSRH